MVETMDYLLEYHKKDVGVIPLDWKCKKVKEFTNVISGGTPSTKNGSFWHGEIRWMNSGELNLKRVFEVENRITELGLKCSATKLIPERCVLIGLAGQGRTRGTVAMNMVPLCTNQSIASILPCDEVNSDYLYHNLDNRYNELRSISTGEGGRGGLNLTLINELLISYPPTKKEQILIATALNDIDELISELKKLINKKRAIRQGVEQELFSPKEGWDWVSVESLGKPYGGLSGKSKKDFEKGTSPYIPFMNIMTNPIIDTEYFDFVRVGGSENQNRTMKGDLFFNGSSETPEEVGMCSVLLADIPNLYLNSFCFGFRLNKELENDGLYLAYFFRSSYGRRIFYILAQGATRHNLSKSNFMKIEFHIPKPIEQKRISTIIYDIDREIAALGKELEKFKMIKKGMMQNLLTGKIRLV
jgi:type I restriction enzyme, S subunit